MDRFINLTGPVNKPDVKRAVIHSFPTHSHSYFEMILYEPFEGCATINGVDIPIKNYTAMLMTPLDFHKTTATQSLDSYCTKIAISESMLTKLSTTSVKGALIFEIKDNDFIINLFNEVEKAFSNNQIPYVLSLINCLLEAFFIKGRHIISPKQMSKKHNLAVEAMEIINKSFSESISLETVADKLNITPQYLSTILKKETGSAFSEQLMFVRLLRARDLLQQTNLSVTEICYKSGFNDLSNFFRCFKKHYGITPGKYRNKSI